MKHFLKRTLAYFIDCIIAFSVIMLIFQWAIFSNIRGFLGITEEWFRDSWNMEMYVLLSISLPVWIYFIYFDSEKSKGTFGKRFLKLSVLDESGNRIGIRKSILRTLLKIAPWEIAHLGVIFPTPMHFEIEPSIRILSIIGIILFVVYAGSILFSPKSQAIYDRILGAQVIED